MLTVSPIVVYSIRRSEPTWPDISSPVLIPMPISKPDPRSFSAIHALKRGSRTSSISRAAATALSAWSGCGQRGPEDGHDPVAEVADQGAAVVHDRVGHLAEVVVEDVDHLVGGRDLGVAGEAADVAEEHRALAAHAAEAHVAAEVREQLVDDLGRDEAREGVAHPLALERRDEVVQRERADAADQQGEQRVDDGDHGACVEGELRGDEVRRGRGDCDRERGQRRHAQAGQRRQEAERGDQEQRDDGRRASAAAARRARSRSRSPGSRPRTSGRRRSRSGGRPGASAPRRRRRRPCPRTPMGRPPRRAPARTSRSGPSRAGRGSRSRCRRGRSPRGSTGSPVATSAAATAKLEPLDRVVEAPPDAVRSGAIAVLPARAREKRSASPPPKTLVSPLVDLGRSRGRRSRRGAPPGSGRCPRAPVVRSVNWTS